MLIPLPMQLQCRHDYPQTFEKRSSLASNPPALGLLILGCCEAGFGPCGDIGAALLHPPKSSSAVIFGGACEAKPPFEAELCPQTESFDGADIGWGLGSGAFAMVEGGSGAAHASFEPHASVSPNPANESSGIGGAVRADLG